VNAVTVFSTLRSDRFDRLDALRGAAIVWMALFHFGFDLNMLGLITPRQNFFRDPLWTNQRTCIVSLFLFCAGLGQAIAMQAQQPWSRFWRRWAQVAGCAVLVSLGSYFMFPKSWISFGVLHGMAAMLVLCRGIVPWAQRLSPRPWPLLTFGAMCLILPMVIQHPFFDTRLSNWLGLSTHKPITDDWVPVLPWLGVMLWGVALGQWLLLRRPLVLAGALPPGLLPLATLGRWSLSFYILHQPVLIGVLMGGRRLQWW
jgi:uncharacterized membrane protein